MISLNCDSLKSTINHDYGHSRSWDRHERAQAKERHAQTIVAILTTHDGSSRAISGFPHGTNSSSASFLTIQTATTYKQTLERRDQTNCPSADFETTKFEKTTQIIFDGLHFRRIDETQVSILKAHRSTFEWIFKELNLGSIRWDSLSDWLNMAEAVTGLVAKPAQGSLHC